MRVIGFSFGRPNDLNELDDLPAVIGKKGGATIIISAHMGGENHLGHRIPRAMEYFGSEPRGDVVAFSHRCIDAGADLVLGHGPHVPRGIELYKNKLIVYSLGNFLFDYPGADLNVHAPGYSITVELDENGNFQAANIHSYDLRQGVPVPDRQQKAYKLIEDLSSRGFGQSSLLFPGNGAVTRRSEHEEALRGVRPLGAAHPSARRELER